MKYKIHFQDDFDTVTPCGIDIFEYRIRLIVTPQWENVTCGHCKAKKKAL